MKNYVFAASILLSLPTFALDLFGLEIHHNHLLHRLRAVPAAVVHEKVERILFTNPELPTRLDKALYAYSACFPLNNDYQQTGYRTVLNFNVLKGIAWGESKYNAKAGTHARAHFLEDEPHRGRHRSASTRTKYQGLFQMDKTFCENVFRRFATSTFERNRSIEVPRTFNIDCISGRADIDTSLIAATLRLSEEAKMINDSCPDATLEDKIALMYIGHNNGIGVLRNGILNGRPACTNAAIQSKLRAFYRRGNLGFTPQGGVNKYLYGRDQIAAHAIEVEHANVFTINVPNEIAENICPLNLGRPLWRTVDSIQRARGPIETDYAY